MHGEPLFAVRARGSREYRDMMDWVQRKTTAAAAMTALLALAGCQSAGTTTAPAASGGLAAPVETAAAAPAGDQAKVVTGVCPQVALREGTAYLRKYAGKAKDAPEKLIVQAALAETTRQCTTSGDGNLTISVMAQGRLVAGPMGKPGSNYVLPVRVAVIEGDKTLYSELVKMNAQLPAGQPSGQFLFQKADIKVPASIGGTAQVFLGFDEGPYNTK